MIYVKNECTRLDTFRYLTRHNNIVFYLCVQIKNALLIIVTPLNDNFRLCKRSAVDNCWSRAI